MNRKTIIILSCTALAVILGIAVSMFVLFADVSDSSSSQKKSDALSAVPTDAAALMVFQTVENATALLGEETGLTDEILGEKVRGLLSSIKEDRELMRYNQQMVISAHYSASMTPLVAVCTRGEVTDTLSITGRFAAHARLNGLHFRVFDYSQKPVFVASPSETLVEASIRHLYAGNSIYDNAEFSSCKAAEKASDAFFVNLNYADKFSLPFTSLKLRPRLSFVKKFAAWVSVSFKNIGKGTSYRIHPYSTENDRAFFRVLQSGSGAVPSIDEIAPEGTTDIVDLPLASLNSYLDSYQEFLESDSNLQRYRNNLSNIRGKGRPEPVSVFQGQGISEIAKIRWKDGGSYHSAICLRRSPKAKTYPLQNWESRDYVPAVFGSYFSLDLRYEQIKDKKGNIIGRQYLDSAKVKVSDSWIVMASDSDMASFEAASRRMKDAWGDRAIPQAFNAKTPLLIYHETLEDHTVAGLYSRPLTLMWEKGALRMDLDKINAVELQVDGGSAIIGRVDVPEGPFKVYNCATKRDAWLRQNPNNSLSFLDENGRSIWSIPFGDRICGHVECIDYLSNGKIQFLFCAGNKLCLIDRLGRFVGGFPVLLGKEVVLGPRLANIPELGGNIVILLHDDNTVGVYNLSGKVPESWQGISCMDTILSVPELVEVNGGKWWVVRNTREALVFPLLGGEALSTGRNGRSIKSDSEIIVEEDGLRFTCNDGRQRLLKLGTK